MHLISMYKTLHISNSLHRSSQKHENKSDGFEMFDAQKSQVDRLRNMGEGDEESGIEEGLKAIEGIAFMEVEGDAVVSDSGDAKKTNVGEWKTEYEDMRVLTEEIRWLRERGYACDTKEEVRVVVLLTTSRFPFSNITNDPSFAHRFARRFAS